MHYLMRIKKEIKMINNKVDFIVTIEVNGANPNGDPLAGNMPRIDSNGYGEISDVCIKRKIRNRMQDMEKEIFVVSQDRAVDKFDSLEERFTAKLGKEKNDDMIYKKSCENWLDVRSFGQVITYNNKSIGIRGPVSISMAKSLEPISITTMQITKSVNGQKVKKGSKSSDTIGSKHYIEKAVYKFNGSVNSYFSEKTGFDEEDLKVLKEALRTLFVNDLSSARPDGSMRVRDIYWFTHSSKIGDVSSGKIKDLLEFDKDSNLVEKAYEDYKIRLNEEKLREYEKLGLSLEYIEGL